MATPMDLKAVWRRPSRGVMRQRRDAPVVLVHPGQRPDEGEQPPEYRPSEQQVDGKDRHPALMPSHCCDDRRQQVEQKENDRELVHGGTGPCWRVGLEYGDRPGVRKGRMSSALLP